jgi:hypothetical protein
MEHPKPASRAELDTIRGKIMQVEATLTTLTLQITEALSTSRACKYILDLQEAREKAKIELEAEQVARRAIEEQRINERVRERTSLLEIRGTQIDGTHKRRLAWVTIVVGIFTTLLGAAGASCASRIKL